MILGRETNLWSGVQTSVQIRRGMGEVSRDIEDAVTGKSMVGGGRNH